MPSYILNSGGSNSVIDPKQSFNVASSATVNQYLDTVASFGSARLLVEILDTTDNRRSFQIMVATKKQDGSIEDQVFGIAGDTINFTADITINASNVVLSVTNNDTNLLQISFIKTLI